VKKSFRIALTIVAIALMTFSYNMAFGQPPITTERVVDVVYSGHRSTYTILATYPHGCLGYFMLMMLTFQAFFSLLIIFPTKK
jgi:hypothetical protein